MNEVRLLHFMVALALNETRLFVTIHSHFLCAFTLTFVQLFTARGTTLSYSYSVGTREELSPPDEVNCEPNTHHIYNNK